MYDYIIVGAGLAGSIIARKLAEENDKKVLVVERREHIAGNLYDFYNEHGIRVQKYGPHVFHTNSDRAYKFICNYCETEDYRTRCEVVIDGISTPSPFNFKTIDQFYTQDEARELKLRLKSYYNNASEATVVDMLNSEDECIRQYTQFLYEKDYKPYTAKQWNLSPEDIDPSVLKRVPIVFSYRDTYFDDKYEFMPKNGFKDMVWNILNHKNIKVQLGEDALKHILVDNENKKILWDGKEINIVYCGAIDELFDYCYGMLPYRSLYFDFKSVKTKDFQNAAIVAYPQEDGYTRVTEYTKMPVQDGNGWTTVAYEYPNTYEKNIQNEPYYPVLTQKSQETYKKYSDYAGEFDNLICCGRLADFKYYNMDQVVLRALDVYDEMEKSKW